ncbi:MAG TPA: hydantoinase/carbamoylase family amidase [Capillimicrobium sp.]|nr:hydantoinase/carbamoylase family amidase [Capillimicrobium sp.]
MADLIVDVDAVLADLRDLAARTGGPGGARRVAWTEGWLEARRWLIGRLEALPVEVDRDEAGNLWARMAGAVSDDGFVIVGSHLDAVPAGGWLDGALGVAAALGVLRALAAAGEPPAVPVALVDWADEEGARFGRSLLGSSAAAGTLDPDAVRDLVDADGVRLVDALAACGVDLDRAPLASARLDEARAYLELHIEQGPVLLDAGRPASAVSGTVGVERLAVAFSGQAAHAGSTPMRLRRDALAAAATALLEIREIGLHHDGVATVGSVRAQPGIVTAVAGEAELLVDLRHLGAGALASMRAEAVAACERAAAAHGCTVAARPLFAAAPAPFDPRLVTIAADAVAAAGGGDGPPIPSGPLHDATEVSRRVPTAMLFAQSDPPLSHTAVEDSPIAALRVAIEAYGRAAGRTIQSAGAGEL